ncbi:unnamed protein product [Ambrosiozyma monospora]|uniref:Unnamed protein product n=1 Tax=Ambrosiozyma monospora TaxID=43982 RepID=A0A9W6YX40_AMBMO|nr:unnamed protein product [Ambrosiozyma monospora]
MMIPYTITIHPPVDIPATIEAEIPHHEFVKPNPTPNIDQNEKLFLRVFPPILPDKIVFESEVEPFE